MNSDKPLFSKAEIEQNLRLLNDELVAKGITGEICIVGGAAMVLAFGSRRSTRDIDALVVAPSAIRLAAKTVADIHGLPAGWLNDGAKGFASTRDIEACELLRLSNLRVIAPPAEYILAMKCISARIGLDQHDKEDAVLLIQRLGLRSFEEIMDVVSQYYDATRIPAKTLYFVREVCDEIFSKAQKPC
ncbi:MAG TPA: DUF6036 family nucleotidyltransferase [Candidatus Paceibacterota bacterium]|nr:DUF6036 family nucleotidyltransferase [Verrucomicrobiota bacterium]HRY50659.1 DUF6036 family nucleotidyltransferase [Candidatus Paceibacterota bacterium]